MVSHCQILISEKSYLIRGRHEQKTIVQPVRTSRRPNCGFKCISKTDISRQAPGPSCSRKRPLHVVVGTGRIVARCDASGFWHRLWLGTQLSDPFAIPAHLGRKNMGNMGVFGLHADTMLRVAT